jgi:hypothetical protein
MLIPRFSLRWLLIVTTVCGLFFYVVALATQGSHWAIAVSAAIATLLVNFLVYAVFFAFGWLLATLRGSARSPQTSGSPFATAEPPAQIIPPPNWE